MDSEWLVPEPAAPPSTGSGGPSWLPDLPDIQDTPSPPAPEPSLAEALSWLPDVERDAIDTDARADPETALPEGSPGNVDSDEAALLERARRVEHRMDEIVTQANRVANRVNALCAEMVAAGSAPPTPRSDE